RVQGARWLREIANGCPPVSLRLPGLSRRWQAGPPQVVEIRDPPGGKLLEAPTGAAEPIVYTGLDNIELIIGKRTAITKVHHVIFDLGGPVVPQSGPDAKHPPSDGLVDRDRGDLHAIYSGAGGPATVGPGPAHFAVDQPIVEGVADPRSECGDPIEARLSVSGYYGSGAGDRCANAVLYGRPREISFDAQHPLIDLVIEPDLTAADQAGAIIGPADAGMNTGIESGPVIDKRDRGRWGRISRPARHIGGFGCSGC